MTNEELKTESDSLSHACSHCRGAQYVFVYWLEKIFYEQGIHMTDTK